VPRMAIGSGPGPAGTSWLRLSPRTMVKAREATVVPWVTGPVVVATGRDRTEVVVGSGRIPIVQPAAATTRTPIRPATTAPGAP
jgi:hypothetical protein